MSFLVARPEPVTIVRCPIHSLCMRLRQVLPIANTLACVLFVALGEPAPADYLAEVDEARRNGGVEAYLIKWAA